MSEPRSPCLNILHETNQWTLKKKKKKLWICFCSKLNHRVVFSPLQVQYIVMEPVSSLLCSLSGSPRRHQLKNLCALPNSSANVLGQHAPPGRKGEGSGGHDVLGLRTEQWSLINRSGDGWSPLKAALDACGGLLLPVVLPPRLQPLASAGWLRSRSDWEGGSRRGPWG